MSNKEDIGEERVYSVPLNHVWIAPVKNRTSRGIKVLRNFIKKNMRADTVMIDSKVNEKLWSGGVEGTPRKIRVKAVKDENDVVRVYLVEGE